MTRRNDTRARRAWKRPAVRKLGTLAELTRTTDAGQFQNDSVTNTYFTS